MVHFFEKNSCMVHLFRANAFWEVFELRSVCGGVAGRRAAECRPLKPTKLVPERSQDLTNHYRDCGPTRVRAQRAAISHICHTTLDRVAPPRDLVD